jgi:hypothetical protein
MQEGVGLRLPVYRRAAKPSIPSKNTPETSPCRQQRAKIAAAPPTGINQPVSSPVVAARSGTLGGSSENTEFLALSCQQQGRLKPQGQKIGRAGPAGSKVPHFHPGR